MGFCCWNLGSGRVKTEEKVEPEQDFDAPSGTFTWKIKKFSNLKPGKYVSNSFIIIGTKWYALSIFPIYISLFQVQDGFSYNAKDAIINSSDQDGFVFFLSWNAKVAIFYFKMMSFSSLVYPNHGFATN